jgi:hypothetical protein
MLTSNFYLIHNDNSEGTLVHWKTHCKINFFHLQQKHLELLTMSQIQWFNLNLHKMANRVMPYRFIKCKLSLLLYRTFIHEIPVNHWLSLNFDQIITRRQTLFNVLKTNNFNVGMNVMNNKLRVLNGNIPLDWLNLSADSFKIMCKRKFLNLTGWYIIWHNNKPSCTCKYFLNLQWNINL